MKRAWRKRLLRLLAVLFFLAFGISLYAYLNLRDLVIWYANRGNPRLELDVGRASLRWNGVELSEVLVKLRENNEEIARIPSARIGFSWSDLGQHRIGTVTLHKPHLRITDRLLEPAGSASDVRATNQVEAQPWQIRKFAVIDGSGEIDLATVPLIRFSFGPELYDLQLSSETQKATAPQAIAVEQIEFLTRGANPQQIGSINRIELKFSQGEAEKLKFDELIVRAPSFQITPEAVATLGPISSSNAPSASIPNLRIGKLIVENGELFLKKFGETIPEGSLKFGMETTDLQLGESGTGLETRHAFQLWDVRLAPSFAPLSPFTYIDSLQLEFTTAGLFQRKEITGATLTGMTITMGQTFRSYMNTSSATTPPPTPSPTPPTVAPLAATAEERLKQWKLRELKVVNSHLIFADLGVGSPTIGFNIATTLKDIPLSAAVSDTAEDIQQQEIADFTITSPLDQFAPVFTMKTLFIRYSIAGLLRREIEEIQVLNPTIYVGEDLFWYFNELSKREEQTEAAMVGPTPSPEESGWKLKKINLAYGQLVIASEGKARLPLPLQFTTSAENLNLGKLSDLKLALDLKVPREDYLFPGYKLELRQLAGNIRFDLPPETRQNNLVQTLRMSEVRWRQFRAEEGWLAITFDSKGINGQIGAKGYGGYLDGGFTSFFGTNSPWVGWLSGTKVDLKKITDVLAPGNFTMDGPADFKLEANGAASHLERLRGSVKAKRRGQMRIGKLDQILADIPGDWYWVKRELTRIVLETLRDFTYDSGDASFWFLNDEGNLKLTLQGPKGSRNIDVVLHAPEDAAR